MNDPNDLRHFIVAHRDGTFECMCPLFHTGNPEFRGTRAEVCAHIEGHLPTAREIMMNVGRACAKLRRGDYDLSPEDAGGRH